MEFWALFLIAIGLSMDAFAAAICRGLKMPRVSCSQTAVTAAFFGGFQAFMPLVGWLLGKQFERYIMNVDHWVAFFLLMSIGGKMVFEAFKKENPADCKHGCFNLRELLVMAIATSIDALAVGVTFAFLQTNIWICIALIGCTTFLLSGAGVLIGHRFGAKHKNKAELAGGLILILIGLKILLEHLGIIRF